MYTDGGCEGNPGPGGWGAILIYGKARKEISGADPDTTNNRMELTAAIESLRALKQPCEVALYTDSEYLRLGMTSWLANWKAKGWRTATKKPVKNRELWEALDAQASRHRIHWHWVKGHSLQPENERCDQLAAEAIAKLQARSGW